MDIWTCLKIVLICVVCVVAIVVLFLSGVCAMLNSVIFLRQDKNPSFKYFAPEDFNLTVEHMSVYYGGTELAAGLYTVKPVEECDRVVIFAHGFGAGTSSYMTEIAHFAQAGFAVVATDAYGCNNSAGKKIKGFYAGAEALIATYIGVKRDDRLKNKKIILVGHSWGAYSVLAVSRKIKVDGVVAMSAFNAPAQCVCDQLGLISKLGKILAPLLHPFFFLGNIFKFGFKGNTHAAKAIEKSGIKALLIHGEKDRTVIVKHSAAAKAAGDNVQKLLLPDKKHNPYNTAAAEQKLAELTSGKADLQDFDWHAATEEDEEVMGVIDRFIAEV